MISILNRHLGFFSYCFINCVLLILCYFFTIYLFHIYYLLSFTFNFTTYFSLIKFSSHLTYGIYCSCFLEPSQSLSGAISSLLSHKYSSPERFYLWFFSCIMTKIKSFLYTRFSNVCWINKLGNIAMTLKM